MLHDSATTTTGSPRVQRKRAAKQAHILDVALELLGGEGVEGLTISRLAKALDYTPGALYRYFESKDAIFAALQRRSIGAIELRLESSTARGERLADEAELGKTDRALLALLSVAEVYVDLLDDAPELLRLIGFLLADPRTLVGTSGVTDNAPVLAGLLGKVSALFTAAAHSDAIHDGNAFRRTLIYWSSLQGIVQLDKMARLDPRMFAPRALGAETARTLLLGWGADPDALTRCHQLLVERP